MAAATTNAFDVQRGEMVRRQLRGRDIHDSMVLETMETIPRHLFVPSTKADRAYGDHPLPIGYDQTISQPYIVALMTQSLQVHASHRVLEVGTGSGYQTAILCHLARHVYSVERCAALAEQAEKILHALHCHNVSVIVDDGSAGWPEHAPFDRIMVTAAAPAVPPALLAQLSKNGGRMLIPTGGLHEQVLLLVEKQGEKLKKKKICECVFVKLIGKHGWRGQTRRIHAPPEHP